MKKSPGIILTSKFTLPTQIGTKTQTQFSNYFDYMKREEALKEKSTLTEQQENELKRLHDSLEILNDQLGIIKNSTRSNKYKDEREKEAELVLEIANGQSLENENEFFKYAGYMFRAAALKEQKKESSLSIEEELELALLTTKREEFLSKPSRRKTSEDLDPNKKYPGTFSINQDSIKVSDMESMRKIVDESQKKGSVMWQDVISFDNSFLEEHGILNSTTDELNEEKVQRAARKMMDKFISEENINNPYWFASIHRNTKHIHIHFSTVERNPSREVIDYKSREQPKGKRKQKTLDKMKTEFGNQLVELSPIYKKISNLRNESVKELRDYITVNPNDLKLLTLMDKIDIALDNGWEKKVNSHKVSYKQCNESVQRLIDETVDVAIESNSDLKNYLKEYYKSVDTQNDVYYKLYGKKYDDDSTMKSNREKEMKERMGNSLLKGMAAHKLKMESIKETIQVQNPNLLTKEKKFKRRDSIDKLFWRMKQKEKNNLENDLEQNIYQSKRQAMNEYEETQRKVKQAMLEDQYQQ